MKKGLICSIILALVSGFVSAQTFGKVGLTGIQMQNVPASIQEQFLSDLGATFELHTATKIIKPAREGDYIVSGSVLGYKPGASNCRYNFKIVNIKGEQLASAAGAMFTDELEDGGLALKLVQKFGPYMNAHYSEKSKTEAEWIAILMAETAAPESKTPAPVPETKPAVVKVETGSKKPALNPGIALPEKYNFYSETQILCDSILVRVDEILNENPGEFSNIKAKIDFYNMQTERWIAVIKDFNNIIKTHGALYIYDLHDIKYSFSGDGSSIRLEFVPGFKLIQNKIVVDTIRVFFEKWDKFVSNPLYADMKDGISNIKNKMYITDYYNYYVRLSITDDEGYPVPIASSTNKTFKVVDAGLRVSKNYDVKKRQSKYFEEEKWVTTTLSILKNDLPDELDTHNLTVSKVFYDYQCKTTENIPSISIDDWNELLKYIEK